MILVFDIFQIEASGEVRWQESAASLEDAKARIQQLAGRSPGKYLVLNQETGSKLFFTVECAEGGVKTIAPC